MWRKAAPPVKCTQFWVVLETSKTSPQPCISWIVLNKAFIWIFYQLVYSGTQIIRQNLEITVEITLFDTFQIPDTVILAYFW
jgi:hypothetical protein